MLCAACRLSFWPTVHPVRRHAGQLVDAEFRRVCGDDFRTLSSYVRPTAGGAESRRSP